MRVRGRSAQRMTDPTALQPHRAHSTHGLLYTTTKLTLDPPTAALFINGEYVDAEGAATLEVREFYIPLTTLLFRVFITYFPLFSVYINYKIL